MSEDPDLRSFAATFQKFLESVASHAPAPKSPIAGWIEELFGSSPAPVIIERFPSYQRADLQRALDGWLQEPGRTHTLDGVKGAFTDSVSLSSITAPMLVCSLWNSQPRSRQAAATWLCW